MTARIDDRRLSRMLADLVEQETGSRVTLGRLIDRLGDRSFGLILLVLALPAWIPVLPPPVRAVFGLPLGIAACQMLLGRSRLTLPEWFSRLSVDRGRARRIVDRTRPWLERIERWTRPRLPAFVGRTAQRRLGALLALLAALIAVPLPMTTSGPALATAVIAVGLIEHDGAVVIAGIGLAVIAMAVIAAFWTAVAFGLVAAFEGAV